MAVEIHLQHVPPSTNTLYANVAGRGRIKSERYRTWLQAAGWDMKAAKIKPFTVPVYLSITIGKLRGGSDISNRIKAVEDLLVIHGVIPDDSIKWVKGVYIRLADKPFDGFTIAIMEAE
jgi:Holliday junction resolvase RusA-like endonuclease